MYKFYYTNGYGVTSYIRKSITSLWQNAWNPNIRKWLMRINLTCLMLLIAFMQVSLAANAQKISLSKKNAPLTEIFKELRKQSGYDFVINKDQMKIAKPVTILVNGDDLINVLNKCFDGQPFTYSMEDKMIIVINKKLEQANINAPLINVKGRLVDENGTALAGASVSIRGSDRKTVTNGNGEFSLANVEENAFLVISFIGYEIKEISVKADLRNIKLIVSTGKLNEVSVVSTGYQTISKERATGSFVFVDSTILNQRVTTNILDKLDGVVSGLIFNRNLNTGANNSAIAIRGRSTLFGNPNPLIVLDNFPYDGNLDNINPNDIENISVLKDAAAASIWGVRAGNGVIVITTKKGKRNGRQIVGMTSNVSIQQKPDIYAQPWVSSSDYIELEQLLFRKGQYTTTLRNSYTPVSPALQVMVDAGKKLISSADSANFINALKNIDARDQWDKFYYQPEIKQQYQLNIQGGSNNQKYFISGGYDNNRGNMVNDNFSRLTLNANNTYYLIKDKLELFSGITFTNNKTKKSTERYVPFLPYDLLTDQNGEALEIGRYLRPTYTDTAGKGKLLDWKYRPLNEQQQNSIGNLVDYKLNLRVGYTIIPGLKLSANYQYQKGISDLLINHAADSYFTRNMINSYSSVNSTTGVVTTPIAPGAILNTSASQYSSQNARVQADIFTNIGNGELNVTAGAEIKDFASSENSMDLYGYDESTAVNSNALISATTQYRNYYSGNSDRINTSPRQSGLFDRYRSYFAIGSYIFKDRYTVSGSLRKDESNLFGVKSNQKGVPLWSVGGRYEISKEKFYNLNWLPNLSLRATYGYNGNVDKSTSAYLTSSPFNPNPWNYIYSQVINPPNPSLSWERVQNINFGLDYSSKNSFITGSIEYFVKRGKDLIANSPIVPQTGITTFKGNSANTRTSGLDIVSNINWYRNEFSWSTNVLVSYSKEIVTDYKLAQSSNINIVSNNYRNPLVGYPYNSIFSFKYSGLDANGNPLSYLNGQQSQDYSKITSSFDRGDIIFNGSATPQVFGAIRNNLIWKGISLTVNITYKLGYYVRRESVFNGNAVDNFQQFDYDKRWKQSGDELFTDIPSLVYPANNSRATIFTYGEQLVEKADHIRLQYVQLSCPISKFIKAKDAFSGSFYFNMSNLGILWKSSSKIQDPDFSYGKAPVLATVGFKLDIK